MGTRTIFILSFGMTGFDDALYPCVRGAVGGEFQQVACDAGGIVAGCAGFFQIISEHRDYSESLDFIEVVDDLAGTLNGVFGFQFF